MPAPTVVNNMNSKNTKSILKNSSIPTQGKTDVSQDSLTTDPEIDREAEVTEKGSKMHSG
jgi:hypothetical protein